jgi:hypothetical protein
MLVAVACSGLARGTADTSATPPAGSASAAAASPKPIGESIVILTEMTIADAERVDPIATGNVLEGSVLGGSPFCAGGTVLDVHASNDPGVKPLGLIDRVITCPNGTMRIVFTPRDPGFWTIFSGTGAFDRAAGGGSMTIRYDPAGESLPRETLNGTVTR